MLLDTRSQAHLVRALAFPQGASAPAAEVPMPAPPPDARLAMPGAISPVAQAPDRLGRARCETSIADRVGPWLLPRGASMPVDCRERHARAGRDARWEGR